MFARFFTSIKKVASIIFLNNISKKKKLTLKLFKNFFSLFLNYLVYINLRTVFLEILILAEKK